MIEAFFDGAFNWQKRLATYGYVVRGVTGSFDFSVTGKGYVSDDEVFPTHNVAEYYGLLGVLTEINSGIDNVPENTLVCVQGDSNLVIKQMATLWRVNQKLLHLHKKCKEQEKLLTRRCYVEYRWIKRELNKEADRLAGLAMREKILHCKT